MKIVCEKSELLTAVNIVLKAVPVKTTMTILQCILIDACKGVIRFRATDMDMGIETFVEGIILEEGQIALEAKLFSEIIRKLPDNEVTLDSGSNFRTLITCEKAKFNIAGRSGDDFVPVQNVERTNVYTVSQFSLKEIIRQTIFSTSDNDSNPIFSGEYLEFNEGILKAIALDGQRIAIRKIGLKKSSGYSSMIVPGKTLSDIGKIIGGDIDKDVNIYVSPLHLQFEFDRTIVVTRLIEGKYFQVERMISSDYSSKISINKRELQDCIERASLLVKESERKPAILKISGQSLELSMVSQIGSMNEQIDINAEGKDIEIGFNVRYLLDALRVIDEEEITMYFDHPISPFSIKSDDLSYHYIILPISIG